MSISIYGLLSNTLIINFADDSKITNDHNTIYDINKGMILYQKLSPEPERCSEVYLDINKLQFFVARCINQKFRDEIAIFNDEGTKVCIISFLLIKKT